MQSRRNADGSGIGFFGPAGTPVLDKQPEAAFQDEEFTREAKQARSPVFVAHVRWATAGGRTVQNTHPFAMQGRIMAHNGGLGDVGRLAEQLGSYRDLVLGETDSEHYFALITQQIDAHDGDVGAGIAAAAGWIAARLPVSSLNTVISAPGELWALRYPGQHALHILERPAGASIPATAASGAGRRRHGSGRCGGGRCAGRGRPACPQRDIVGARARAAGVALGRRGLGGARRGTRLAHARPRRAGPRPSRSNRRVGRGAAPSPRAPGPAARRAHIDT